VIVPSHLLVVDDDDDVRETLQIILENEGFVVTTAANGREALGVVGSDAPVSAMLLDLRMPELDGWQTIEALRASGALGRFPILICTSAPTDAPEGFPVVRKPVALAELLGQIRALLR
jgi:CheY-like chemotaxis protein